MGGRRSGARSDVARHVPVVDANPRSSLYIALALAAIALRPQLVALGPLENEIRHGLDISRPAFGILSALPVVGMGVFALGAAPLARRLGTRTGVSLALWILTVGSLLRAGASGYASAVAMTIVIAVGMGLGNTLPSMVVKERASAAATVGTAVYATGIQVGAAIASALAVPLAAWLGGWRASLAALAVLSAAAAVAWPLLVERTDPASDTAESASLRSRTKVPRVWKSLAIVLAGFSCSYYGLVAWLTADLSEAGWTASSAGAMLAVLNIASILATIFFGVAADRVGTRARWAVWCLICAAIGLVGIAAAPGLALVWVVIYGAGGGAGFAVTMTLPLDLLEHPVSVAAVAGRMLFGGYVAGAAAPPLLGLLRDVTGSYDAGFLGLAVISITVIPILITLEHRHHEDIGRRNSSWS